MTTGLTKMAFPQRNLLVNVLRLIQNQLQKNTQIKHTILTGWTYQASLCLYLLAECYQLNEQDIMSYLNHEENKNWTITFNITMNFVVEMKILQPLEGIVR